MAPVKRALREVPASGQGTVVDVGDLEQGPDHAGGDQSRGKKGLVTAVLLAVVLVGCVVAMFSRVIDEAAGILALVAMLVLIFLRVPIGIALLVSGGLGVWAIRGFSTIETVVGEMPYQIVAQWSLGVLPMFIFVGILLWRVEITTDVYVAARRWMGWLPGGLAVATNFAGAGLAAVSGSTTGTMYALGRSSIPEMLKAGYRPRAAVAAVVVAGLPGQLIPPSIMLVIYAGIAGIPVGPQLLAGIGPGVVVAVLFGMTFVAVAMWQKWRGSAGTDDDTEAGASWRQRWTSLLAVWPVVTIILLVIGGIFSGVFTATEAGAVAAFLTLIVAFVRKGRESWKVVALAARETVATTGVIFLLVLGAHMLSLMLTLSDVSDGLAEAVTAWFSQPVHFLLFMVVVYLAMGMFLDPLAIMLLTVPILVPVLQAFDVSLLWYGVFTTFMVELALVTPPVGMLTFIFHRIVQEPEVNRGHVIRLSDIFIAVAWTLPVAMIMCLALIFFPEIATFIPDLMGS